MKKIFVLFAFMLFLPVVFADEITEVTVNLPTAPAVGANIVKTFTVPDGAGYEAVPWHSGELFIYLKGDGNNEVSGKYQPGENYRWSAIVCPKEGNSFPEGTSNINFTVNGFNIYDSSIVKSSSITINGTTCRGVDINFQTLPGTAKTFLTKPESSNEKEINEDVNLSFSFSYDAQISLKKYVSPSWQTIDTYNVSAEEVKNFTIPAEENVGIVNYRLHFEDSETSKDYDFQISWIDSTKVLNEFTVNLPAAPAVGADIDDTYTIPEGVNYQLVTWNNGKMFVQLKGDGSHNVEGKYEAGKTYKWSAVVCPNEGYTFANSNNINYTVTGINIYDNSLVADVVKTVNGTTCRGVEIEFRPLPYTVSFNTNGGTTVDNMQVRPGGLIPADNLPVTTRTGYDFVAWYKDDGLSQVFEPELDEINGDLTLYAKWNYNPKAIENVVFKGVVTPVDGATPSVSTITVEPSAVRIEDAFWVKDDGYNTPATQFVEKERYLLFIHIEPQDGYKLDGMNEDKMTVNGTPLKAEFISERNEFVIYYEATKSSVVEPEGNSTIVDPVNPSEDPASLPVIDTSRLEQVGAGTKTIKLSYNKIPEANGYFVYQKSGKKWKKVATIKNVNTTTATIKKLKAGTKYTFKVVSYVTSKKKVKKKTTTVYTPLTETDTITAITTPDKPKKPSIKATNFETEKLTFKKPKGTYRIEIFRSTAKKGTYEKVGEVTGTSFTDTGLKTGTTYYYKIRACNFNCSGFTSVVSKKLTLSTPRVKVSSPEAKKVLVRPTTVAGEDGYIIQYSTKKNKGFKEVANLDVYTSEYLQETIEGLELKSKKTYYYRVRAYRVVDGKVVYSSWSKVAKVKVK